MANSVKPGSGIGLGYGKAFRAQPSGLVKPKGFDKEFNAKPQHSAGYVTPSALGTGNGTALPWDSVAEGQAATAGANYKNTVDQVAANRAIGLQEFGLDEGYNDYKANPFSQAALLQHNHESNARGINTTAGQALYSGQTGNAQTIEQNRTYQAHQGLVGEEERAKANWLAEEKAAEIAQQEAINQAKEGAIQRATEAAPPEVPLPEGNGGGGGGDPQHPNAKSSGVSASKGKPNAPNGWHAYKGPNGQWWFAPNS